MISQVGRWVAGSVVVLGCSPAFAGQVIHTASIGEQAMPWTNSVQVPAFDRALGRLDGVIVFVSGSISGTFRFENTTAAQVTPFLQPSATFLVSFPGLVAVPPPAVSFTPGPLGPLAPYDGTTDFTGPSGLTQAFGPGIGNGIWSQTHRPDLDLLCVPPYGSGMITITLSALDNTPPPSPTGVVSASVRNAGASIAVFYEYTPGPTVFCDQPEVSPCPCGNHGTPNHGCANSVQAVGARLDVSGTASIGADTLTLSGSFMTSSSVLYFQGTDYTLWGTAFGDGRRCVTGTVRRLGTKTNVAGASQYPAVGDATISVAGQVIGPGLRVYQAYYRDLGSFCTPAGFNVTSAQLVTWTL